MAKKTVAIVQRYRDGKLAILIATDIASRGIDVDDVDCVINFDIPEHGVYGFEIKF